jgi:hypothetical protein
MLTIKNVQFSKLIKIEGRLREFNFRKLTPDQTVLFSIDVADERQNRIIFQMKKEDDAWKIVSIAVPEWIQLNEKKFHEVIEEELASEL